MTTSPNTLTEICQCNRDELRVAEARLQMASSVGRYRSVRDLQAVADARRELDANLSPAAATPGEWLVSRSVATVDTLIDRLYVQPLAEIAVEIAELEEASSAATAYTSCDVRERRRKEALTAAATHGLEVLRDQETRLANELQTVIDEHIAQAVASGAQQRNVA